MPVHEIKLLSGEEMANIIAEREGMNTARRVKLRWILTVANSRFCGSSYRGQWQALRGILVKGLRELDKVYDELRTEVRYRGTHYQFPSEWWSA